MDCLHTHISESRALGGITGKLPPSHMELRRGDEAVRLLLSKATVHLQARGHPNKVMVNHHRNKGMVHLQVDEEVLHLKASIHLKASQVRMANILLKMGSLQMANLANLVRIQTIRMLLLQMERREGMERKEMHQRTMARARARWARS